MRRSRGNDEVAIETHRGHQIVLNKLTGKFAVLELGAVQPVDSIQQARNAIERHIKEMNKGVRRKVLVFNQSYMGDDKPRKILEGELSSWTRSRGYRFVEGVVVFSKTSRETYRPEDIFEDTNENRRLMHHIIELELDRIAKKKAIDRIKEKELARVEVAEAFAVPSEE